MLDSVILLDAMSSDEDTVEDVDTKAAELDAQERTDRLMSMAEYRDEIYEYLRKSEVCSIKKGRVLRAVCLLFCFLSVVTGLSCSKIKAYLLVT